MIWIAFAVLTVLVLAVLLSPVLKSGPLETGPDRDAYDRAVFRDQLAELDRDLARGAIGEKEAEAARNEISRRLIGATSSAPVSSRAVTSRSLAFMAVLVVPLVAIALYYKIGNPQMPDVPLALRLEKAVETGDFVALIAKVEKHLSANPQDVQGWQVLAPAYQRAKRWRDAANAYASIIKLSPPNAALLADHAEMLIFASEGMVSADAHRIIAEALKLDPALPKARFFDALALKQEGKTDEARAAFERFLVESPADAPWRPMLEAELKDLASRPPALSQQALQSAEGMTSGDQQAMIRSMVDGLDERLKTNGDDLDGWLRLIRARTVLNEAEKAAAAYGTAKTRFKDNPEALAALDGLARELNIQ